MTVRELLARTDSRELVEWQVYLNLDSYRAHFDEKAMSDKDRSERLKQALFGRAIAKAKQDAENGNSK